LSMTTGDIGATSTRQEQQRSGKPYWHCARGVEACGVRAAAVLLHPWRSPWHPLRKECQIRAPLLRPRHPLRQGGQRRTRACGGRRTRAAWPPWRPVRRIPGENPTDERSTSERLGLHGRHGGLSGEHRCGISCESTGDTGAGRRGGRTQICWPPFWPATDLTGSPLVAIAASGQP
jgi:hypothetical protein